MCVEVGDEVVAYWGMGDEKERGKIISECDRPQVLIETTDGRQFWWRRDMVDRLESCNGSLVSAAPAIINKWRELEDPWEPKDA